MTRWSCDHLYPSLTSWCARATILSPFCERNFSDTSGPNRYPAPRGDVPHSWISSSGSDHIRSHIGPWWGTSLNRSCCRMLSNVSSDGESPPCVQKIVFSMTAVSGMWSKVSVNSVHTVEDPYFRMHSS
eukprot:gene824-biopygen847